MRRVQMRSNGEANCTDAFEGLIGDLEDHGRATFDRATGELKSNARLFLQQVGNAQGADCDACNPSPNARFLGADNQTLRLMMTGPATFVWALDDGAPIYRAEVTGLDEQSPTEVRVTLLTPPRDEEHFPLTGRVVEILPFSALLDKQQVGDSVLDAHFNKAAAELGAFTRVATPFDPATGSFTVDLDAPGLAAARDFVYQWPMNHPDADELMSPVPPPPPPGHVRSFYVRFWHVADASKGEPIEIPLSDALTAPALGTTGLVPTFTNLGLAGDFWIATLRPDSPQRPVVPFDLLANPNDPSPSGRAPDGPRHFYAPLAFVSGDATGSEGESTVEENDDCRLRIRPLADDACTKLTVGDCRTSIGQFSRIQDAIDALPPEGGLVMILPGFYQEDLIIHDRPGVILEGCGADTVIQSLELSNDLISITGQSPGVRIRSLTLIGPSNEIGILCENQQDLKLSALHLAALPNAASTPASLLFITSCTGVTLEGIQVDTGGRTAIEAVASTGIEASGLTVTGSTSTNQVDTPAILLIDDTGVRLRDSSVHTFAQTCLQLRSGCENTVLERLTLTSEPFLNGPLPALAAIDAENTFTASISECRIQQVSLPAANITLDTVGIDAAVVLHGRDILFEKNQITAPEFAFGRGAAVWGGVQVRGSSTGMVIRETDISGGVGHGITLGSVLWQDSGSVSSPQRFGAGKGQIEGAPATGFGATGAVFIDSSFQQRTPISEGSLADVELTGNRIESMSSNGISTFAMLGVPFEVNNNATELIQLDGLRIEDNTISSNLQHPATTRPADFLMIQPAVEGTPAQVQLHALGGIVLSDIGTGAEIRGNIVANNSPQNRALPVSGIFIVVGEAITICSNKIVDNGFAPLATTTQDVGVRGGVVVLYAGTGAPAALSDLQNDIFQHGGNTLPNDGSSLRVLNNAVRQPEGRALYVIAAGPVAVAGNFLSSTGFHGSLQDEFALGDVILIQDVGGPWERFDIAELQTTDPIFSFIDYATPTPTARYLFNTIPESPRLFVGVGGQVSFLNNQVTYDWLLQRQPVFGAPLAIFPVALMTLDHLAVTGNQFAFRVRGNIGETASPLPAGDTPIVEPVLAHLFAAGATADVTGNRLSETFGLVNSSIWSLSELVNFTNYNQTTHRNFTEVTKESGPVHPTRVFEGNQVMFPPKDPGGAGFDESLHLFFQLLFRTNLNTSDPSDIPPPPGD
jgi:hypothetical protein